LYIATKKPQQNQIDSDGMHGSLIEIRIAAQFFEPFETLFRNAKNGQVYQQKSQVLNHRDANQLREPL
jgi:hypothetical protein